MKKCRLDDICPPKNCRVFGSVLFKNKLSPETEIILDTGASFSVISQSFLSEIASGCKIRTSKRNGVVDASGQDLNIIGDVTLTLRIEMIIAFAKKTLYSGPVFLSFNCLFLFA